MRRFFGTIISLMAVGMLSAYASGLLTGEVRYEDACVLCRATRLSGRHYGFSYGRIDDSSVTTWYRQNIDPQHGLDPQHPHVWEQSACTVNVRPGWGLMDYSCSQIPTLFLLRPDIELEALLRIPDKHTQIGVIHALNTRDRKANAHRVRLLIEYYYIARYQMTWPQWWQRHAGDFGMGANRLASR